MKKERNRNKDMTEEDCFLAWISPLPRFVEGGSLHDLIQRFGRLPEVTAALYMEQALCGIAFLHEKKIIHR